MTKRAREVALMFAISDSPHAELVRGIMDYEPRGRSWRIDVAPDAAEISVTMLEGWGGDGVITLLDTPEEIEAGRQLGVPLVNLSGVFADTGFPRVAADYEAIGRLAAEHLLECGLRRFGYYGVEGLWFSELRRKGFLDAVRAAGGDCSVLDVPESTKSPLPWNHWMEPLERWLGTLRPPVGILAVHDFRARVVIEACRRLGLRVPTDIAVMGVDNDHVPCELSPVPISSVERDNWRAGYEAAALLDRLMNGGTTAEMDLFVQPKGVVRRRSTDILVVDDPYVTALVQYIRDHVSEPFGVERLSSVVPVSRRWLEIRFKQCLDCTPLEYIRRVRVERAKELLGSLTPHSMDEVAAAAGFSDATHLRKVFQRVTGTTPSRYRREHVSGDGSP